MHANCPQCQKPVRLEALEGNGWFLGCTNEECDLKPSCWSENTLQVLADWNDLTRAIKSSI